MVCEFCKNPECKIKSDYWQSQWNGFVEGVFWENVCFMLIALLILCLIFGWWGILLTSIVVANLQAGGGNWIDLNEYPEPETNNICSAGILDCSICDNAYSHEFNASYERNWYEKW